MITRTHHVQITILKGKEKEARDFYCGLMGLKEIPKPESLQRRGGFWLQVGDQQVHIGVEDEVERKLTKAHVAYEVNNLALLRQRIARETLIYSRCHSVHPFSF